MNIDRAFLARVSFAVLLAASLAACNSSGNGGSTLKYPGNGDPANGKTLFLGAGGCAACHTVAGTPANGNVGPDLTHVGSRLNPDQIYTQISDPMKRPAPYATPPQSSVSMPTNSLTPQQRADITAWLATLK